ncbi:sensor histidine kinase [Rhodoblastus acidophilus]|uniref:histidine kinase n=1 Tax=Candidatus Rhodoblastus alkanivorans TaxID=2954117 RepID=A0ABS9Z2W2_9HYPH|nr:sensor histidine kinase [Candidatus Rhodoblastus alkanivorans]MCI4681988.1 sensor histidine kinase [Candidatus Rhodoblastus alkanivorans]MDI4643039.1 sensor histidine kinase [Rhodoblastus acidophilus]
MTRRSLRLRLALAGALAICLALATAGAGLTFLFERHVYRTLSDDLETDLRQLIGGLEIDAAGKLVMARAPQNPRFDEPLSGLYWQVSSEGALLRSRSLWDTTLTPPQDRLSEGLTHYHQVQGPGGKLLLLVERRILVPTPRGRLAARVIVASDLTRLRQARDAFVADLVLSLAALALFLGLATWLQLSLGLRPLRRLRQQIAETVAGQRHRLAEDAPDEVMPLVREVNQLLSAQERALEHARSRAADLAHGLKTPLAGLAGEARTLRRKGDAEIADALDSIGETMRRHIERELARARIGAAATRSGRCATPLKEVVDALIRTLGRTEKGEKIAYVNAIGPSVSAPFERLDLTELLGNLLDNATRHAASQVRVSWSSEVSGPSIRIEDDGPGLDPALEKIARRRGGRLDQGGGAGLGLAIATDILDAYGWRMDFSRSTLGGLAVRLSQAGPDPNNEA